MFKEKERNKIHDDIMQEISNEYDKTEGSFIYDATKPVAIRLEEMYKDMSIVAEKLDIEKLSAAELEQKIYQMTGLTRKAATKAIGQVEVKGNGTVAMGSLFETESGIQFEAIETRNVAGLALVKIQCLAEGVVGNVPANQVRRIPITIAGITEATNPQPTNNGFEAEGDKALLQRYYERIKTPTTSGNRAHYKSWAKEVQGVGDAKVFPLWAGDNTVKVVIINELKEPADSEIVEMVQGHIDPNAAGAGEGAAPIGAHCTVESAVAKLLQISFDAVLEGSYTKEAVEAAVRESLRGYFREVSFTDSYISYAIIGSLILQTSGIVDYTNLSLNGGATNIYLEENEIPVLGEVAINED